MARRVAAGGLFRRQKNEGGGDVVPAWRERSQFAENGKTKGAPRGALCIPVTGSDHNE